MYEENGTLHRRFANDRPGRDLVLILDAALPVTRVEIDVLGQEKKGLPIVEEFVLRLVNAGIDDLVEMSQFLGLEQGFVEDAAAAQLAASNLSYSVGSGALSLTVRGRSAVHDLESIEPVEVTLPLSFDRLTWTATDYPKSHLIKRKDAEDSGLLLLPAAQSKRVVAQDFSVERLNELLRERAEDSKLEILGVRRVRPKQSMWLPVKLLVYADASLRDLEVAVCIDGDLSPDHDAILARNGGAEALDISVAPPTSEPQVDEVVAELVETALTERSIARPGLTNPVESHGTKPRENAAPSPSPSDLVPRKPNVRLPDQESLARPIGVYEHPEFLSEALTTARSRLLILSPWIKRAVVDTTFFAMLERRLRAGTHVHIAYGYAGPEGKNNDEQAVQRLRNLQGRFEEEFTFTLLRNSHAKILIWDNSMITGSFNWLSFKGSRDREFRIEEGMLVTIPEVVDGAYERYVRLIGDNAATEQS